MNSPYMGDFKVTQEYKGNDHDGLDLVGIASKEIHSTVNGIVEFAGWENSLDQSQGFGQYVKIIDDVSGYGYYFGHMSSIKVKVGDRVKITDIIGIEAVQVTVQAVIVIIVFAKTVRGRILTYRQFPVFLISLVHTMTDMYQVQGTKVKTNQ